MADSIWQSLFKLALNFLNSNNKTEITAQINLPVEMNSFEPASPKDGVDWTKGTCQVSKYFTVYEAMTLHSWNRLANEEDGITDQVKTETVKLCLIMDQVRELLGCPINVHCIFRSVKYNQEVLHSLPQDVHSKGMAIDFDCNGHYTIEQVKEKLRPILEKFNIRMEGGTTTWVHLDTHAVGPSGREFKA